MGIEMDNRVLIVDDSLFMRYKLKNLVESLGGVVVGEAADGIEAIEKFQELQPDLTFLDITMPRMNGICALKEIKARNSQAKVIMVTAMSQGSFVKDALDSGATDYVCKPFKESSIKEVLEKSFKRAL
ncbi:chemotaxis protein CheY [Sporomusaceae bacterium FL31]|nr:chemotaxis protein CheY [Sporomusaceae bacterium FL31]GCE33217.1 chemotaxis protein CheY [Sporomusaceae bacterium]